MTVTLGLVLELFEEFRAKRCLEAKAVKPLHIDSTTIVGAWVYLRCHVSEKEVFPHIEGCAVI